MSVDKKQEYETMRNEMVQRSGFQQAYLLLNITAAGGVITFSFANLADPLHARSLLVVPFLSFVLFMLWIHHAFAIVGVSEYIRRELRPDGREGRKDEGLTGLEKGIKHFALVVALLGTFVGVPLISIYVFWSQSTLNETIDVALLWCCLVALVLNVLAFVFWLWRNYR